MSGHLELYTPDEFKSSNLISTFRIPFSESDVAGRLHSLDQSEGKSLIQRQFLSSIPQIDPNVLNDIELEAQYLASNIDNLTENLCNLVHSVSIFQLF